MTYGTSVIALDFLESVRICVLCRDSDVKGLIHYEFYQKGHYFFVFGEQYGHSLTGKG